MTSSLTYAVQTFRVTATSFRFVSASLGFYFRFCRGVQRQEANELLLQSQNQDLSVEETFLYARFVNQLVDFLLEQ